MHLCRGQRWFAAALFIVGCATASYAQFPGAPYLPGGPGIPGGSDATSLDYVLLSAPVRTLKPMLGLNTQQVSQIKRSQESYAHQLGSMQMQEMRDMQPGQFDPIKSKARYAGVMANFMRSVHAVLTPQQRRALPRVLMEIQATTMAGIPPEVVGTLKLTAAQSHRIEKIVRSDRQHLAAEEDRMPRNGQIGGVIFRTMARTMSQIQIHTFKHSLAVLTPAQRHKVTHYLQLHPPDELPGGVAVPPGVVINPSSNSTTITTTTTVIQP